MKIRDFDKIIHLNYLASVYYWTFSRELDASALPKNKFTKLYQKLHKEGVIDPKKFENLRMNQNFVNQLETFDFEESIKSPVLLERIGNIIVVKFRFYAIF